ncbi:MAG TPA: Ldh family oxidoreductase [Isosphaeraceae bacterium]
MTRARKRAARYRLDDLRRCATALGAGVGLASDPATALATHLLWFDAAGAARHGIGSLPGWLERIERREIDPGVEGKIGPEHAATAVLDGQGGLGPWILARAAGVAAAKARDAGVGLVRVTGLGPSGPAAPIVAELAIGPQIGLVLGPLPHQALALPTAEGLPLVIDSALDEGFGGSIGPLSGLNAAGPAIDVVAVAVTALEALTTFHERLGATTKVLDEAHGRLLPGPWEERRREARERGVSLDAEALAGLRRWAERLGVEPPAPWTA